MSQSLPIELDDKSIEILKSVDSVHRNSLVNVALAMISKTPYYRTLMGLINDEPDLAVSLESLDLLSEPKEESKPKAKKSTNIDWDEFQ